MVPVDHGDGWRGRLRVRGPPPGCFRSSAHSQPSNPHALGPPREAHLKKRVTMKRFLVIGVMLLLATPNLLDRTAYAGEKFVLRASLYRVNGEDLEVGDAGGHRLRVSDWIGVVFNASGSGFLDTAQHVVKSTSTRSKAGGTLSGYKIFTKTGRRLLPGSRRHGSYRTVTRAPSNSSRDRENLRGSGEAALGGSGW